jgi:hypothetical protein
MDLEKVKKYIGVGRTDVNNKKVPKQFGGMEFFSYLCIQNIKNYKL